MWKIGKTSGGHPLNRETFELFKRGGIDAIEIRDPPQGYDNIDYSELVSLSREYDLELWSYHIPFVCGDISSSKQADKAVPHIERLIDKAAENGIKKFIIHASFEPISDVERPERMARSKENLFHLAEFSKQRNAVMCVESLPRTCLGRNSTEILELIGVHEDLRVCFDTNHVLCEDPVDFARKVGNKIVTTHISDCDLANERHWLPGEGKVRWYDLYREFIHFGYQGVWLYEMAFDFCLTIMRERDLTCEDFVRNAHEIFEGKPLTVLGVPKESLFVK